MSRFFFVFLLLHIASFANAADFAVVRTALSATALTTPLALISIGQDAPIYRRGSRATFTVKLFTGFHGEPELRWHVEAFYPNALSAPSEVALTPTSAPSGLQWTGTTVQLNPNWDNTLTIVAYVEGRRVVDEMLAIIATPNTDAQIIAAAQTVIKQNRLLVQTVSRRIDVIP